MLIPTYYTYKLVRDYGFAPNPFNGTCTLATCKPKVRGNANVGDWVIGCGAKKTNLKGYIIYLMQVAEKLTFEEYWNDQRFQLKKPIMNVGLKRMHGDNIYYKLSEKENDWGQINSQHSLPDGLINPAHLKTDISGKYVLLSNHFFYFGDKCFKIPQQYQSVCSSVRDTMKVKDVRIAEEFIRYIEKNYSPGVIGEPINWKEYDQLTLF